jgi:uncharacterized protein (TIGR02246 family)
VSSLSISDVQSWLDGYRRGWEENDPETAAALFTEDAVYHSSPFDEPHVGRDGIHAYWADAVQSQSDARVLIGRPVVEGDRVAVEWWATWRDAEEGEVTLPGILMLRFAADGRCAELREAWNLQAGRLDPYPGWGA